MDGGNIRRKAIEMQKDGLKYIIERWIREFWAK